MSLKLTEIKTGKRKQEKLGLTIEHPSLFVEAGNVLDWILEAIGKTWKWFAN